MVFYYFIIILVSRPGDLLPIRAISGDFQLWFSPRQSNGQRINGILKTIVLLFRKLVLFPVIPRIGNREYQDTITKADPGFFTSMALLVRTTSTNGFFSCFLPW